MFDESTGFIDSAAPHHSQVQDSMGIPFNLYFGALAIAHCGTLAFLGIGFVQQQSLERQIWQLSLEIKSHRERENSQVLSGGGYPDPSPGVGIPASAPGKSTSKEAVYDLGRDSRVNSASEEIFKGLWWLILGLVGLLVVGLIVVRFGRASVPQEVCGSPVNQKLLAQRQLAELRLRRNGFSQSSRASGIWCWRTTIVAWAACGRACQWWQLHCHHSRFRCLYGRFRVAEWRFAKHQGPSWTRAASWRNGWCQHLQSSCL